MLNFAGLFAGTFLEEISEILETGIFFPPETQKGEKGKSIRPLTLLEKAFYTLEKRSEGEKTRELHSVLWKLLIEPSLTREQRDKSLVIRDDFDIVETAETPLE